MVAPRAESTSDRLEIIADMIEHFTGPDAPSRRFARLPDLRDPCHALGNGPRCGALPIGLPSE